MLEPIYEAQQFIYAVDSVRIFPVHGFDDSIVLMPCLLNCPRTALYPNDKFRRACAHTRAQEIYFDVSLTIASTALAKYSTL
jgi:hypothetical protein